MSIQFRGWRRCAKRIHVIICIQLYIYIYIAKRRVKSTVPFQYMHIYIHLYIYIYVYAHAHMCINCGGSLPGAVPFGGDVWALELEHTETTAKKSTAPGSPECTYKVCTHIHIHIQILNRGSALLW
jgi:hypothetical protein